MDNFSEKLKQKTKQFAIEILKFSKGFNKTDESYIIKKQLLRSAFSVAANYRAVCRARSNAEFISKLSIVVEEADECVFWIELSIDAEIISKEKSRLMLNEANEILAIMSKSRKTIKNRINSSNQ
ncbi:MAG: four helix bundle protein [Bacteroidia bacterium]